MAKQPSSKGGGGGKSSPAPVTKDSKGNIDPRFGTRTQKEQGVYKSPTIKSTTPKISTNNLFAYSYTKPFQNPVGVDKKKKGKGKGKGGGTGETPPPPPPPPPGPPPFEDNFAYTPPPVMVPERDVVNLATEQVDAKTIENLLFENIGANELVKFVRHDTVEGNNPSYNIISNLSDIRRKFNPDELISVQQPDSPLVSNSINLNNKIPSDEYLEALGLTDYVYIDGNGNLVIEVINMRDKEILEIQIDSNGTIYEVN